MIDQPVTQVTQPSVRLQVVKNEDEWQPTRAGGYGRAEGAPPCGNQTQCSQSFAFYKKRQKSEFLYEILNVQCGQIKHFKAQLKDLTSWDAECDTCHLNKEGKFSFSSYYARYTTQILLHGKFFFTLTNVFRAKFEMERKGEITWNGIFVLQVRKWKLKKIKMTRIES